MPEPLRILFVASECAPFAKTGGLGDVLGALPPALAELGHEARVFVPLYARIDRQRHGVEPVPGLERLRLPIGNTNEFVAIHRAAIPGTRQLVHFVASEARFGRPGIYTEDPDEHRRFVVLCQAALVACQYLRFAPHVVHANDWQTALLPLYVKATVAWDRQVFGATKSLLTIHNVAFQGFFPASVVPELGLENERHLLHQDDLRSGVVNLLKTGLLYADLVTTVSPTYARELQTPEHGFGLDALLRERGRSLVGVLNGIDTRRWSPASDPLLAARYDAQTLERKTVNRDVLLEKTGLLPAGRGPVVGIIARLTLQKGLDLALGALPRWIRDADLRVVVLGSGDPGLAQGFQGLERAFRGRVCFYNGFSEELAHLIEAGSDIFLMPSRFEPCGLNQMYSLAYGSVPIVRRTGGLADTVRHWNPATREGTGFVFEHPTAQGVSWALGEAIQVFRDRAAWLTLVRNGMAQDYSWERQAARYVELYRALAG